MIKNKILVICGPTATGKTALALKLAKKFKGEILSADSRQVYSGMDIVTGKDLPSDGSKIWLTDLVNSNEDFSVSQWRKSAVDIIHKIWKEKKLPIIVGGTGLYIKALTQNIETIDIPQNKKLREQFKNKNANELYEVLTGLHPVKHPVKARMMNRSDKHNPRRLVRAIEIELWKQAKSHTRSVISSQIPANTSFLMIGLNAPQGVLFEKIRQRVIERIKKGAIDEVKNLLENGISWEDQSMSAVGYKELKAFFEKRRPFEEAINRWVKAEQKYAKRQITWFKKEKDINWFDITKKDWEAKVEKLVANWYNRI